MRIHRLLTLLTPIGAIGGAAPEPTYGANLHPDSTCDTSGSWTFTNIDSGGSSGVSLSGGKLVFASAGGDQRYATVAVGSQDAGEYLITIDVDAVTVGSTLSGYAAINSSGNLATNGNSSAMTSTGAAQTFTINPSVAFTHLTVSHTGTATLDNILFQKRTN